ncbi:MAG: tetratricopeptide repeat protein [Bacteriovoracaceae bacterium]|jgi:TolA-binding protein|nr:hypothetical protein [Halobacteriovoraceae bacterium]MDP7321646.1 tetratricopeptide repeat protein [Bacteriovoracaceae bacterium]
MMKVLIMFIPLFLLTSCFKTAEEIKREQRIDQQMEQSSKIIADLNEQISILKMAISSTSGQLEEIDHKSKQTNNAKILTLSETVMQLKEQVKALTADNEQQKKLIQDLSEKIDQQSKFIKKVTGTLSKIGSEKKTSNKTLIKQAHTAFEANKQKKAKELYLETLQENKINNAQKNHVYYNLGLLNYWSRDYNDALVYFSKIYTKYPRSSFAPKALLYIARSFDKLKKTDEAKATYQEVIEKYPKSSQATKAKKEIK